MQSGIGAVRNYLLYDHVQKAVVRSPFDGAIVSVARRVGDLVREGDPLVVLAAMKMETVVGAPCDGTTMNGSTSAGGKSRRRSRANLAPTGRSCRSSCCSRPSSAVSRELSTGRAGQKAGPI